jgi:catechol 2,3-dioxygenase-like lactoylglutathione lyase family enzyme
MAYPFEKFHHICIVVRDITAKVKYFESIGVGPWLEYPPLAEYTELDVPGTEGFMVLKYTKAIIGNIEIQLVQPSMEYDSPQKRFLEEHGEGVYHVGFVVDDANEAEKVLESRGVKTFSRGRRPDQSGFNYLDTMAEAGICLLTCESPAKKG